jgi:integrase
MLHNSVYILMTRLKKMIIRATKQGTVMKNPFLEYSYGQSEMVCRYLQPDELEKVMKAHIPHPGLCYLRDMFVFACFTGLAYIDLFNLSEENLMTDADGKAWICTERQKSKTECRIPLMKLPLQIIEKYRTSGSGGKIFKRIPIGSLGAKFRELKNLCGIRHLSFHSGRHTFATQIMLSQGVPITSISKILGHTNVKTTQIYAKVTGQKVNEDMKVLSGLMKGRYVLPEVKPPKKE